MQARTAREQRLHVGPLVNAAAIQEHDHVAAEMPEQGAEKDGDLDVGDVVVGMKVDVEAHPPALGTDGDGGDRRNLVASIAVPDDRGLPPRGPRPPDVRDQEKPAFVEEHHVGPQALGFF